MKFAALYDHTPKEVEKNPDEIDIDLDEDDDMDTPTGADINITDSGKKEGQEDGKLQEKQYTRFLALDKILPGREFLQVITFHTIDSLKHWNSILTSKNKDY